jgi:hypothetical protein
MIQGLPTAKTLEQMMSSTFIKKHFAQSYGNTSFLAVSFNKHRALSLLISISE